MRLLALLVVALPSWRRRRRNLRSRPSRRRTAQHAHPGGSQPRQHPVHGDRQEGRFITDLNKGDFQVLENKQPQPSWSSPRRAICRCGWGAHRHQQQHTDRFRFIQEAAVEFITSVMRPKEDKALVVSFDSAAELVSDLNDDPGKLAGLVRDLRPGGGTALFDAIYFACRNRLSADQPRHKFRRAMIILSDGDDNQSEMSREQSLEMAQKADVVIYTISTNITRVETDGDKVLKYLAAETGGQAFFPSRWRTFRNRSRTSPTSCGTSTTSTTVPST